MAISFEAAQASKSYGRLVHVWLPEDEHEAHRLLVDLSRGTRTASASDTDLHQALLEGGFSHHPTRGTPSDGYMVSIKGSDAVHHLSTVQPEHLAAHRAQHADHLAPEGRYQGGWLDKGTNEVYLDVSHNFGEHQEHEAREFAMDHQQKAYYHLGSDQEYYLHPQHDPLYLESAEKWVAKYKRHFTDEGIVPARYRDYEHLYPPSKELQDHLARHGEHMARLARERIAVLNRRYPI